MKDFEKVYSEYHDDVFQYVLSLCHDESWAEEITQEAFFKALIYIAMDSFGTATNVTGDGAIAVIIDRIGRGRKG